MEFIGIILVIIITLAASFLGKKRGPSHPEKVPQTWEEMEEYYGISIDHEDEEPQNLENPTGAVEPQSMQPQDKEILEETVKPQVVLPAKAQVLKNSVKPTILYPKEEKQIDQSLDNLYRRGAALDSRIIRPNKKKLSLKAKRQAMAWSIILEKPKALKRNN